MKNVFYLCVILIILLKCSEPPRYKPLTKNIGFIYAAKKDIKDNSRDEHGNLKGEVSFTYDKTSITENWDIFTSLDGQIEINLPENCLIEQDSCCALYCTQNNYYFTIIVHNKEESGINAISYLQYLINVMREDGAETVIDYNIESSDNDSVFFAYFNTQIDSTSYNSFCCITQDQDYVYDMTLKVKGSPIPELEGIKFYKIVRSLVINGRKLVKMEKRKSYEFDVGYDVQ